MTKESITELIAEIERELPAFSIKKESLEKFGTVDHMDDEFLSYVNGVGGSYVKFLALLTKKLELKNIVELGNREGLSTLAIYDQLPSESSFTSIDIIEDVRYCPESMFSDPRVHFIIGDVCDVSVLKKVPFDIDLLFSDTIHFNFQIRDEFAIYQHLLADNALVAIDDIHTNDKGKFWDDVIYDKWDLTELCHGSGWGLFLFKRKEPISKEERWLKAVTTAAAIWQRKYYELYQTEEERKNNSLKSKAKRILKKNASVYSLLIKINNLRARYF